LWLKYAGKLPFDDSEWDDGFTTSDCQNHRLSRCVVAGFHLIGVILTACAIYTLTSVIIELIRVRALKFNATSYSMFFLLWAGWSLFFTHLIYFLNTLDADKVEYWYDSRTVLFTYAVFPLNAIIDFEIGVTWIDLYDRTKRMSKRTSWALILLRVFIRCISFALSFGIVIWVGLGGILNLLQSALVPTCIGLVFISIAGFLIIKTLSPKKVDTSNPNWKVLASIKRSVQHGIGAKIVEIIGLTGMILTIRHPQIGHMYGYFNICFFIACTFRQWGWIHYLIHGSRKHLKKYADKNASAYFGFTTIGLNRSFISSKTSALSKATFGGSSAGQSSAVPTTTSVRIE
ncbi:hypothetical protein ACHAXH_002483, partial [Discostella pseudostelligera]